LASICVAGSGGRASAIPAPEWWRVAACVGLAAAGWLLHMSVRVGSQRLILAWGAGAVAMALVLEPAVWVVLTTAAGMAVATFAPPNRSVIKAGYNTALYTVGAAAMAAIYTAVNPGPRYSDSLWPLLPAMLLGATASIALIDLGVQAVLAAANRQPFTVSYGVGLRGRLLQVVAELGLVLCITVAAVLAPQYLYAVPVLAIGLQLAHRGAVAAAAERASTKKVFEAIQAFSAELDEVLVAQRATEQLVDLLTADAVEIQLHGNDDPPRQEVLVRAVRAAAPYIGSPAHAPQPPGHLAAEVHIGDEAPTAVRVFFTHAVDLNDRDTAAVRIVIAAVNSALATARAHADLHLMAARAAHEASHDHITGLPGRRLLHARIADTLQQHPDDLQHPDTGQPGPVAAIVMHIADWPALVEASGVDGDEILRQVAHHLQAAATLGELVSHLGGDTFVVFLSDARSVEHTVTRAQALLADLATPIQLDTGPIALSGAAGLAYANPDELTAEELLRRGRVALRRAHHRGSGLETYHPDDDTRGPAAVILHSELRAALTDGDLELHYQPKYDLLTGKPVAVEAVPRWRHPGRGMLPASAWIDLIEGSNLLPTYLDWLLREALRTWTTWNTRIHIPVTVNIPGRALLDPNLASTVITSLTAADAPPAALGLEIAESRALSALDTVDRTLGDLADAGIALAIDDFGSAHSSIERLRRVPASEIKLAPDYSHDLFDDVESRAIITAVVGLADQLDLRVTAVDIPTPAHAAALARLGVHNGQGHGLRPPVHPARILPVLQAATPLRPLASADIIALRPHRRRP
jgi:diguanylate cyclase (GGDEF)-like protein